MTQNGGDGISAGQASVVRGNTVSQSGGDGVQVTAASLVEQNTLLGNGLLVPGAGVNATGSFNRIVNNLAATGEVMSVSFTAMPGDGTKFVTVSAVLEAPRSTP